MLEILGGVVMPVGGVVMFMGEIKGEWLCLPGSVCRSYIDGCGYVCREI